MVADLVASFLIVFAVVGGTELIDRTNFALIGLAAKYRPLAIWGGAALAFWITTALAVAIGTALLTVLGGQLVYLRLGGGIFLLAYAAYLMIVPESARRPPTGRSAATTAFLLILLLEIGDTTMIFIIGFVLSMPSALVVGLAGGVALSLVAALACLIGRRLGQRVAPRHLERAVPWILVVVGALTIVYALSPGWFPSFG